MEHAAASLFDRGTNVFGRHGGHTHGMKFQTIQLLGRNSEPSKQCVAAAAGLEAMTKRNVAGNLERRDAAWLEQANDFGNVEKDLGN